MTGILSWASSVAENIAAGFSNMQSEITIFLLYGTGIFLIFYFGRQLLLPIRLAGRIIVNGILGAGIIALINLAGSVVSIAVPLNAASALTVGILGLPGAALLIAIMN